MCPTDSSSLSEATRSSSSSQPTRDKPRKTPKSVAPRPQNRLAPNRRCRTLPLPDSGSQLRGNRLDIYSQTGVIVDKLTPREVSNVSLLPCLVCLPTTRPGMSAVCGEGGQQKTQPEKAIRRGFGILRQQTATLEIRGRDGRAASGGGEHAYGSQANLGRTERSSARDCARPHPVHYWPPSR